MDHHNLNMIFFTNEKFTMTNFISQIYKSVTYRVFAVYSKKINIDCNKSAIV